MELPLTSNESVHMIQDTGSSTYTIRLSSNVVSVLQYDYSAGGIVLPIYHYVA